MSDTERQVLIDKLEMALNALNRDDAGWARSHIKDLLWALKPTAQAA